MVDRARGRASRRLVWSRCCRAYCLGVPLSHAAVRPVPGSDGRLNGRVTVELVLERRFGRTPWTDDSPDGP